METREIILAVSAIIVVIGWFVNSYFIRKHEIAKIRSEYRIDTLKNYISFYIEAQNTKSLDGFNEIQVQFYLYGYNDEITLIEKIAQTVTTEPNNPEWLQTMQKLNILVRNKLRVEIGLPKVKS
ncbi:hypothetical protein BCT55_09135 [Vibrio splendidus]|uniref:hypothetical protein n=1 Tax=Vibrio splendidus TaxID=29497 RepID=UPI000C8372BA|nr:hypothetical protein [Vibrio splendidus]PMM37993.1 hypothetical protein BCT55_09135 [Vibrio splendidus]